MVDKEIADYFNKVLDSIDLEDALLKMVEERKENGFNEEELEDYKLYGDLFSKPFLTFLTKKI